MPIKLYHSYSRGAIPVNGNDNYVIDRTQVGTMILLVQVAAIFKLVNTVLLTGMNDLYTNLIRAKGKRLENRDYQSWDYWYSWWGWLVKWNYRDMLTKIKAATIALESGVPIYIYSSSDAMIKETGETRIILTDMKDFQKWLAFYAQVEFCPGW